MDTFRSIVLRGNIRNSEEKSLPLLYKNGYPPEWDEEVFEKVMEQAKNFKKYGDEDRYYEKNRRFS